jgi:hypothetical protein
VLFKKEETSSEPSVRITSLPQISESEPETSGTLKGSSVEEYLIIEQEEGRRRRGRGEEGEGGAVYEGDEKSSGSPSSNAPILPDILASRCIYMYMQWFFSFSTWLCLMIILCMLMPSIFKTIFHNLVPRLLPFLYVALQNFM